MATESMKSTRPGDKKFKIQAAPESKWDADNTPKSNVRKNWTPMTGVSLGYNDEVESDGIKIRGTGAATKGIKARGPMA